MVGRSKRAGGHQRRAVAGEAGDARETVRVDGFHQGYIQLRVESCALALMPQYWAG
jgi:hypothetical protein